MKAFGALSKYRIISKLGAGGMGEVYKAEDMALLRTVAIKVIAKREPDPRGAEMRFLREARVASQINHPNIVTIYEISETNEHAYIVMEYVAGPRARDLILKRALDGRAILEIAIQTSDALAEAHSRGVIHRDIKPENILLTERNQVKLLDFGLAKSFNAAELKPDGATVIESLTESGAVMGTLSYMSPEQLRDEPLDERTDIFSFGIVLYEMVTGRLPFSGANSFEVAASILKDDAIDIDQVPSDLPRDIKAVVMRCLEKDRKKRYSTFSELRRELVALKQKLPQPMNTTETTLELPPPDRVKPMASRTPSAPKLAPKPSAPPTILVLPLEAVGSGEESKYIGIGFAHAITTDLAKISGLSVLSKSAGAGRRDEAGRGARELARELGATILLEGEVMRAGQTIGVMARLTDVENGRVIWGAQYRGDASDLFNIQDAVCEGVADALKVSISNEVRERIARPVTSNIYAFEFYSKGRAFLERHDVKENIDFAIQMFEEALHLDPEFALAQAGLGEAYWRKYQTTRDNTWVERAIAASDRALVLDPYQAQVHISLGIIYHGTGKIERAMEEFERATELQPLSDDAYRWLGRCYIRKGKMEQAISRIEKAIEIRPGYWDNYNLLGVCYYTFGRYRDAAEQFRRVITFQPDNYQGYENLGGIHFLLGLYEDAVAMHRRAIEIYPSSFSYSNLGSGYFYLGRYEEAIEAYKASIELNPHDDVVYRNLGDAYLRVGRWQDAEAQFKLASKLLEKCLGINPDDALLVGRLAICQAKLRRKKEALASIEQATSLEPHNTSLMYLKAVVYALTGHSDKAIEHLSRALAHGYSRSEAERDPDLDTLRDKAEYKSLFSVKE